MKRKGDIIDYDPIQMIAGAGLVFMVISSNGRIAEFDPERSWIGGVIKGGHEADCFTRGIERFSANENFGNFLKISFFYLGFSLDEIKYSHSILSELLDSYRVLSKYLKSYSENSNETL